MLPAGENPVKDVGVTTERAAAGIVIGCLVALILLRRGFRGVGVPGVGSVGIGR
jgi:hypothetical protein